MVIRGPTGAGTRGQHGRRRALATLAVKSTLFVLIHGACVRCMHTPATCAHNNMCVCIVHDLLPVLCAHRLLTPHSVTASFFLVRLVWHRSRACPLFSIFSSTVHCGSEANPRSHGHTIFNAAGLPMVVAAAATLL